MFFIAFAQAPLRAQTHARSAPRLHLLRPDPDRFPPASTKHTVFPAGPSYVRSTTRKHLQRSFAEDDEVYAKLAAEHASKGNGEEVLGPDFDGLGEEEEDRDVLASDPKEWKKQDHYAILGLGHLRFKATDDHIRVARASQSSFCLARWLELRHVNANTASPFFRPPQGPSPPPGQEGQLWRRQQRLLLQVHPEG